MEVEGEVPLRWRREGAEDLESCPCVPDTISPGWVRDFSKNLERATWRGPTGIASIFRREHVLEILSRATVMLAKEPTLVEVSPPHLLCSLLMSVASHSLTRTSLSSFLLLINVFGSEERLSSISFHRTVLFSIYWVGNGLTYKAKFFFTTHPSLRSQRSIRPESLSLVMLFLNLGGRLHRDLSYCRVSSLYKASNVYTVPYCTFSSIQAFAVQEYLNASSSFIVHSSTYLKGIEEFFILLTYWYYSA